MSQEAAQKPALRFTVNEWQAEAVRRFGTDFLDWKFVCPICDHVASVREYQNAGAPEGAVGYSCIGRYVGEAGFKAKGAGPCDYAGGGLFQLNKITVVDEQGKDHKMFEFAEADNANA